MGKTHSTVIAVIIVAVNERVCGELGNERDTQGEKVRKNRSGIPYQAMNAGIFNLIFNFFI